MLLCLFNKFLKEFKNIESNYIGIWLEVIRIGDFDRVLYIRIIKINYIFLVLKFVFRFMNVILGVKDF